MQRFHLFISLSIGMVLIAGCKHQMQTPPTDQQVERNIEARLTRDRKLLNQDIMPSFSRGIATLTGTVPEESIRELAGSDAASVPGVRTVVNDLTLPSNETAACIPAKPKAHRVRVLHRSVHAAPIERAYSEKPTQIPPVPPPPYVLVTPQPVWVAPVPRPIIPGYAVVGWGRPFVRVHRGFWVR